MPNNEKEYDGYLFDQLTILERLERIAKKKDDKEIMDEIAIIRKEIERKLYRPGSKSEQEAVKITIQQKIDMACAHAGISKAELSRRLGYKKPQSFQTRYDTGKFTQEELQDIAQATGGKYISVFQYPDGTEI